MLTSTFASLREVTFDLNHDLNHDLISNSDLNSDNELESAVKKTLAFFDIFDYPLTDWEIYKYLWVKDTVQKNFHYGEIKNILNNAPVNIQQSEGFYFLNERSNLITIRKKRQIIARKKYKRALWVIKILSLLPFIKMIAVCNTLAYDNVREDSDIDLFIITSKEKIWTARLYSLVFLKLLRLRPTKDNKKDKICLNFFVTEENLNLQKMTIENDIYFAYWLKQILPVYNDKIFKKFLQENINISKNINNSSPSRFFNKRKIKHSIIEEGFKSFFEVINSWEWLEILLKWIQIKIMPQSLLDKDRQGNEVVISDKILKFHVDDKRKEIRDEWKDKIIKLLNC